MNKKRPSYRNRNGVPAVVRSRVDSATYIVLAILALLGAFGIDLRPWFEAKRDISIEYAREEAKINILKMELELQKAKKPNDSAIMQLQKQVETNRKDLEKVIKLSHEPGG
ncbi:MAG: hypothetical protein O7D95_06490 [Betaproteobacteria bacterium]|nr:hypothetical protein [Betaproteobacteria bacterium]